MRPSLLLHICCAPCGAPVTQELSRDFSVTGYFYNPNIQPIAEYQRRLNEVKRYWAENQWPLIIGEYNVSQWFEAVKGLEQEPEGGQRCQVCYQYRLAQTAKLAKKQGIEHFATTLTISPHKSAAVINQIGQELAEQFGVKFYVADFKKNNGFLKSVQISKQAGFYRQNYCGCVFSQR